MNDLAHLIEEGNRFLTRIEECESDYQSAGNVVAEAERNYRKSKADAMSNSPKGTVAEKEAWVNGQTADLRFERDVANNNKIHALESMRNSRQQLSFVQTAINGLREEMGFARQAS